MAQNYLLNWCEEEEKYGENQKHISNKLLSRFSSNLGCKVVCMESIKYISLIEIGLVVSVSHRFSDIGSHSQLSNEQKRCISKQTCSFAQNFHKKSTCHYRKVMPMAKFVNQYEVVL